MQDLGTWIAGAAARALLEQPGTDDEHARAFMDEVSDELTRDGRQEAQA
jgi:hypothetical protein